MGDNIGGVHWWVVDKIFGDLLFQLFHLDKEEPRIYGMRAVFSDDMIIKGVVTHFDTLEVDYTILFYVTARWGDIQQ